MIELWQSNKTRESLGDGIASLLRAGGLEVVGQASSGSEAVDLARSLCPDLVLMDVKMPGMSGVEATRVIKFHHPEMKVVLLTVSDEDRDLFDAIKAGADGYILKDTPGEDFGEMLSRVFQGEPTVSPSMAVKIFGALRETRPPAPNDSGVEGNLTWRELDVLKLAAAGAVNKEIATQLGISESTVNYHMQSILSKLHLKNRTEAAAYAASKGLLRDRRPSVSE